MRLALRAALASLVVLLLLAGCKRAPAATPTPTPAQTLEAASARMAHIKTVAFDLTHKAGATPLLPGIVAKEITGQVAVPDRAKLEVNAIASLFSAALQIRGVVIGQQAYITDPLTGAWQQVAPDTIPFTFVTLPSTLGEIVKAIKDPSVAGSESVSGAPSTIIKGAIQSQDLGGLVPTASRGLPLIIQVWVGQGDNLVRQAQIEGRIRDEEPEGIVRMLRFFNFDQPVDITPPA